MRAAGVIEGDRDSMDEIGGEWEREGMGGGLEERLEALLGSGAPAAGIPLAGGVNGILTPVR
jgi:hypothetical protein